MDFGNKAKINIVWIKRDLRTQDHLALHHAEQSQLPYIIVYLFEPSMMSYNDCSDRHLQFVYHSILEMNKILSLHNKKVLALYGEAKSVFSYLNESFEIDTIFSYRESGIKTTWLRDKEVANFFKTNNVSWIEFQRDGVLRGIKNRDTWDRQWYVTMHDDITVNYYSEDKEAIGISALALQFKMPDSLMAKLKDYPLDYQPPGENNAFKYLASFTQGRGFNYSYHISKPNESRKSCGRVSPYLAWGNISVKQAYKFVKNHPNFSSAKKSFNAFLMRLKWHCHFIQKFEVECEYETQCVNRGYETLEYNHSLEMIEAWEEGKTGFPLIDANMRCLKQTGWINFRMRAMLVSFFCHHMDQNWKDGVYHLAKLFLDYEPGIHYPQFQMQAGTTGVNTIRMYNPVKQSLDHDPDAIFIKKWVPELKDLPIEFALKPWEMTIMEQKLSSFKLGDQYPYPIVNLKTAAKRARDKIWGHRRNQLVKEEQKRILQLHTRRRKPQ